MDQAALTTYLNDHLAGATLGCDHARQLEEMCADTPFATEMSRLAGEIEEDRDTLVQLMERLDAERNPLKQAGAWVAEKAGRIKFSGVSSDNETLGRFLALETLSLGVEGKRSLWIALARVREHYPQLQSTDLDRLIARAQAQRDALEAARLEAAEQAFVVEAPSP